MNDKTSRIIPVQVAPDNGLATAFFNADGRPTATIPNQLWLASRTFRMFSLKKRIWFPLHPIIPAEGLRGVVNLSADPWGYQNALRSLKMWVGNRAPVFNHPAMLIRAADGNFYLALGKIAPKIHVFLQQPERWRTAAETGGRT